MSRYTDTMPPNYFEALYAEDADPWRFASSDYEREKYAATLAALGDRRFTAALEIGCSIGVLTRQIAERCDALLAVDLAENALAQARERCADLPQVTLERRQMPAEWPAGRSFDLIVLSEVVYYLGTEDIRALARQADAALAADGLIVLVHWTGETCYPVTGDEAVRLFGAAAFPRLIRRSGFRTAQYRLDVMGRP